MNEAIPADIRPKIRALVARASSDDTFALRLREDPEAVLSAEGFTGEVFDVMSYELGENDVVAFQKHDRISCIFTTCTYWTEWG
jgi:hypothetical protein